MSVLILVATLATHLFGGSAGREGTAVQMGGALSVWVGRHARLSGSEMRLLLTCGISGGFASVFGTPWAGAIFAIEVLAIGGIRFGAVVPSILAAFAGDLTLRALGVQHAHYSIPKGFPDLEALLVAKVLVAAVAFGLASVLFVEATHLVAEGGRRVTQDLAVRGLLGGCVVVVASIALGTRDYNGLSLPLLSASFEGGDIASFAFLAKIGLTALTIGVGFKGGEVTPLFVIGATLGVSLGSVLGVDPAFLAALGFVAVFSAAANTPLACVVMGMELFGAGGGLWFALAVYVAFAISGHRGIYGSQRIRRAKPFHPRPVPGVSLSQLRSARRNSG
jgi:H+/Cl- antiporter ClcA